MDLFEDELDDDIEDLLQILGIYFVQKQLNKKRRRRRRRYWVHEINQDRAMHGEYHTLYKKLLKDSDRYHLYFRMNETQFEVLHDLIKNDIYKKGTSYREAISTKERLAVALRFFATGNSFRSLAFNFRMGFSTVREIVRDVCEAIWNKLRPIYMPEPTTLMWEKSEEGFRSYWNFPYCCGALDGKHVNITCPINDVGSYGKNSDGGLFNKSALGESLEQGKLKMPADKPLASELEPLPHVVVADEAFPLRSYLMRPYSKNDVRNNEPNKIYNYRLSRARRIVENSFAILRARWRVFAKPLETLIQDNVTPLGPTALEDLDTLRRNSTQYAFSVRNKFKEYFNSNEGAVPWQIDIVRRGRQNI
ncbi:unnamed protein product [Pieris macdunnoughi]|uniref:DDE Tnp4 domain-containing protein n=1 Tax=Pieris macdunnoughi TaxID=345717 RepID=A0A821TL83_9NEOP|nr:unnamed protein product [Pieris macdunnoughi]